MAANDEHRRLTPTERLHEVTMASLGRPRSTGQEDYTIGESAQGRTYVKELHVYREEGESEESYTQRGPRMLQALRAQLPANGGES